MEDPNNRLRSSFTLAHGAFDLFSGSEGDGTEILALHQAYLEANTQGLNGEMLKKIWSDDPRCVFFNGTGYTYYGLDDWLKLWAFFGPRSTIERPWCSSDVRLIGNGDTAAVTSLRTAGGHWHGNEAEPNWTLEIWRSRSTEIFRKYVGGWRCVHIHISTEGEGPRPEQRLA